MYWNLLLILFVVALIACAVGFYKYVYFLSIGYGFAVGACGIAILIISLVNGYTEGVLLLAILQAALFVIYGARLSGFLLVREIKNASYKKVLKEATGDEKKMPIFVKVTIWIVCAALYVMQTSAMLFRFANGSKDLILPLVGAVISILGLILESAADKQKSAQKKENPNMVATKGLYKISRCPNYCGEITFWTGVFVGGLSTYQTVGQWITTILAYICIVYIMFNGAQRLEKRQEGRYGQNAEYRNYADKTPLLLPFIPASVTNKKYTTK